MQGAKAIYFGVKFKEIYLISVLPIIVGNICENEAFP